MPLIVFVVGFLLIALSITNPVAGLSLSAGEWWPMLPSSHPLLNELFTTKRRLWRLLGVIAAGLAGLARESPGRGEAARADHCARDRGR